MKHSSPSPLNPYSETLTLSTKFRWHSSARNYPPSRNLQNARDHDCLAGVASHNRERKIPITGTAVEQQQPTTVAVQEDRGVWSPGQASDFTPAQRDELRALQPGLDKASDADLRKLSTVSHQAGLNPYLKEIYLVGRWSNGSTVWATQTSIDGFRKVTHRYAASRRESVNISAPVFYDDQGNSWPFWSKTAHNGKNPAAASVTVTVGDSSATSVCTWDEYVQTKKDGSPNQMWTKMGPTMLAKCAEAASHRKVCPISSGLYVDEELQQPDATTPVQASVDRVANPDTTSPQQAAIEASIVPQDDAAELQGILATIQTAQSVEELNAMHPFVKSHLGNYPQHREEVNQCWMKVKAELS